MAHRDEAALERLVCRHERMVFAVCRRVLQDVHDAEDGRLRGEKYYRTATEEFARTRLFRGWPLAVLVNDIDDNAQGAVLAALQDNRRAVLVGEPTKADGAIRRNFHLPDQDGIITVLTGQLERADKVRGWPVRPDRAVELTKQQRAVVEKWLMAKELPVLPRGSDDRAPEDPQLASAVAVLRDGLKGVGSSKEWGSEGGK